MVEQVLAKDQIRVRFPVAAQFLFCPLPRLTSKTNLYLIRILSQNVDNYVSNVYKGQKFPLSSNDLFVENSL